MEIPHNVIGRTRPSAEGMNYLKPADMTGLGRGIAEGLKAIGVSVDQWKERSQKTNRFSSLSGFADLETRVVKSLTEAKRDSNVAVANFPQTAAGIFDNEAAAFLNTVPAELQDEFKFRTDQLKTRVMGDALEFQFTSQDKFFATEITKNLDRARLSLSQSTDPTKDLAAWQQRTADFILSTDLPDSEKARFAREANIALQGMVYKNEVKQQKLDLAHYNPAGGATGIAAAILQKEEGFRAEPYDDGGTLRIGYGTDTVTREDGSVERVGPGSRVSPDDAERDLARRIGEFENTAVGQVGADAWARLPANARGALISVTYNYGSLPSSVVRAIKGGDLHDIANAVAGLGANKERRQREAAIIEGGEVPQHDLDSDPRFAALPFDTRIALREDGEKEANASLTQQQADAKDEYDKRFNTLMNGVLDGTVGKSEIENAYAGGRGWLTDYGDRKKALDAWEAKNADIILVGKAQAKLREGSAIWSPNSTDDKNMLNALFNQRGPEALAGMDQQYVYGLAALASRTHDLPTDAVGLLDGMSRSADNTRAAFALNSLAILKEQAPDAFNQRVSDDLATKVDYWERRKDSVPEDELMQGLRGSTPAERQQRKMLREEARDYLQQSKDHVKTIDKLVGAFVGSYDPWLSGPAEVYGLPWAARGLAQDYQTAFVDAYERLGNAEDATAAAEEKLKRTWGVTELGGQKTLMKYPPQVAYSKMSGSYDWMDQEARNILAQHTGQERFDGNYQLISDDQTKAELEAHRGNAKAPPPSYMVAVKTPHGWALQQQDGRPLRMNFIPSDETVKRSELDFKREQLAAQIANREKELSTPTGLGGELGPAFGADEARQKTLGEIMQLKQELDSVPENPADYDPWYRNNWFSVGPFTLTEAQRKAADARRKELDNADR